MRFGKRNAFLILSMAGGKKSGAGVQGNREIVTATIN